MLRLSSIEKDALKIMIQGVDTPIYIFGSRTDAKMTGGDIDILIIDDDSSHNLKKRLKLLRTFQKVSDQKLDIVILPKDMNIKQKAFYNSITKIPLGIKHLN